MKKYPVSAITFQLFIACLTWSAFTILTEDKSWFTIFISICASGNMFHYRPYLDWFKQQF